MCINVYMKYIIAIKQEKTAAAFASTVVIAVKYTKVERNEENIQR